MANPPRAVTFDLWHTLLYLEPADEDLYNRNQRELARQTLEASPHGGVPSTSCAQAAETVAREALSLSEQGISMPPAAQIERAALLAGRRVDSSHYMVELEALVSTSPFRPAPGASESLAALAGAGLRIGVVANTVGEPGKALQKFCDRAGLSQFVSAWSWSDELLWTKPSPKIFRHCLDALETSPADAVHVGDGAWDIEGARNAGYRASVLFTGLARYGDFYRSVVMHRDPASLAPDYTLDRLTLVPPLASKLLASDPMGSHDRPRPRPDRPAGRAVDRES
jgi:FMN phosphatase YigB (HAD superfamily)